MNLAPEDGNSLLISFFLIERGQSVNNFWWPQNIHHQFLTHKLTKVKQVYIELTRGIMLQMMVIIQALSIDLIKTNFCIIIINLYQYILNDVWDSTCMTNHNYEIIKDFLPK